MTSLFDQTALADLAERLVAAARRAGADAADAVAVRSMSLSVEIREGAVEESQRSESDDVGLRVLVGRRQSVVSTNDIRADVAQLAERAVAMARIAPEDRAQAAEAAGLAVKGVAKSEGASASAGIGGMVLATSHGFRGSYLTSRHSLAMSAIAGEGTAMERDYDFSSSLHATDLDPAEQIGRSAGERAVARLNPRKVATKRVPVVFDRRIAGGLIGHLAGAINGAAVARKTSFLRDKLGERLFKPGIRIIDDPLRKRGQRSRPFDGEGVKARVQAIVDDGVLKTWLLDSATARELNLATTGHAQRGVSSPPSPGSTNLHLEAGPRTPDELIADISDGFYVTEL